MHSATVSTESGSVVPLTTVMVLLRLVSSRKKAMVSATSGRWMANETMAMASVDERMGSPAMGRRERAVEFGMRCLR